MKIKSSETYFLTRKVRFYHLLDIIKLSSEAESFLKRNTTLHYDPAIAERDLPEPSTQLFGATMHSSPRLQLRLLDAESRQEKMTVTLSAETPVAPKVGILSQSTCLTSSRENSFLDNPFNLPSKKLEMWKKKYLAGHRLRFHQR